jgi:hypothetical protein
MIKAIALERREERLCRCGCGLHFEVSSKWRKVFYKPPAQRERQSPPPSHRFPELLPDGKRFLFYAQSTAEMQGVYLGSLDGGEPKS